jgi:uncharacterized protein (DUF362 family)
MGAKISRRWVLGALAAPLAAEAKSKVVVARDAKLRAGGAGVQAALLGKLLDNAVRGYFNVDTAVEAWRRVARPGEVVGLKVNCLAGKGISTRVELVEAICERLREAGVPAKNIVVWDRLNVDLESAGFRPSTNPNRVRYMGNDALGYGSELQTHGNAGSLICRTLTDVCDAVINLPVLKDHGIVGATMALKNMFGAIHNPNKYHLNVGDPYVADVYMLEPIRRKVRLHLCDAITAQYEGGPSFMPQWTWPFNGLLVAQDPVALDATGWRIIEQKRAERGMPPLKALKREPAYIARAASPAYRLGVCEAARIERVEI